MPEEKSPTQESPTEQSAASPPRSRAWLTLLFVVLTLLWPVYAALIVSQSPLCTATPIIASGSLSTILGWTSLAAAILLLGTNTRTTRIRRLVVLVFLVGLGATSFTLSGMMTLTGHRQTTTGVVGSDGRSYTVLHRSALMGSATVLVAQTENSVTHDAYASLAETPDDMLGTLAPVIRTEKMTDADLDSASTPRLRSQLIATDDGWIIYLVSRSDWNSTQDAGHRGVGIALAYDINKKMGYCGFDEPNEERHWMPRRDISPFILIGPDTKMNAEDVADLLAHPNSVPRKHFEAAMHHANADVRKLAEKLLAGRASEPSTDAPENQ